MLRKIDKNTVNKKNKEKGDSVIPNDLKLNIATGAGIVGYQGGKMLSDMRLHPNLVLGKGMDNAFERMFSEFLKKPGITPEKAYDLAMKKASRQSMLVGGVGGLIAGGAAYGLSTGADSGLVRIRDWKNNRKKKESASSHLEREYKKKQKRGE